MPIKKFYLLWAPVVLWCGVIFICSSIPTLPAPKIIWWDFVLKKSAHMIEYGILFYFVYRAFSQNFSKSKKFLITVYCLLFTLMYAFSDEYHQSFVPGRHCKLMDIGFDFLGMFISLRIIKKRAG
jgi:VanZ family protein